MTRRSTPQCQIDELAFPIRAKFRVPRTGLGTLLSDAPGWLKSEVGPGNYAQHSAETLGGDAMAVHFRRASDLARFLEAFPLLELADGTTSPAYTSPMQPLPR
jgi:hypothetical protein